MNDTTTPLWLQVPEPSELVRRFGSAADIPAFGGRLEVNWAPGAVTSAGGACALCDVPEGLWALRQALRGLPRQPSKKVQLTNLG